MNNGNLRVHTIYPMWGTFLSRLRSSWPNAHLKLILCSCSEQKSHWAMQSPELLLFLKALLLEAFWHRQREVGEVLVRCGPSHFPNVNKSHRIASWYRRWRKEGRERWNRVHILKAEHLDVPLLLPNPPSGPFKDLEYNSCLVFFIYCKTQAKLPH